ncbi:MAG TPA: ammonia-forming cytochrome c nitrite reductase [Bacteroidales bacterium]|nr:ammonia-forming cytochrome c nitrite reductase [Bacteroidales bacterium]HOK75749.1 ammonia-forming cytochrome c nitrite reductase [Bacteroidales bacterium]HOM39533.1 ammonia-forming cytochrome c nitrite reductase [Bacteroidales bacterium]HPP91915.1 ammonia-forming cytochrome c nitrite reductase [Bacteroidales bacterium]HQG55388.1 ammonia-forming cytochrome c nitrite reductase [Bacteroidales bacterium]
MNINELLKKKSWLGWVLFLITVVAVFFLGLLASSIIERRSEAVFAYAPQITFPPNEPDNSKWGEIFPREYNSYLKTSDTSFRSRYNGSASIDMLETNPEMVILWAGYSFSKDYRQGRGHYYSVTDIRQTLRTGTPVNDVPSPAPNTCWTCKSSNVPGIIEEEGAAGFYRGTWEKRGKQIINPIGCADCHDSKTMNLRISRQALLEAYKAAGKDIGKVSFQEMRSLVCAQCHVEYYFNKNIVEGVDYLVFPWKNGLTAEDIERYYDELRFTDWTHALSRAPMLKAQHPDYEVYMTGTHASRGVSCADCHMPFISEGGQKFTDHHIQSPLNNVANSCQVCHREETERLVNDVYLRQDKIMESRKILEGLLVKCHFEAKAAWDKGAKEDQMKEILNDIRRAQWRWDFATAGHGNSFHSPLETLRLITSGISIASEARLKLSKVLVSLGYTGEVKVPDISEKAKAQRLIGLDIEKLTEEKSEFLKKVVPVWNKSEAN